MCLPITWQFYIAKLLQNRTKFQPLTEHIKVVFRRNFQQVGSYLTASSILGCSRWRALAKNWIEISSVRWMYNLLSTSSYEIFWFNFNYPSLLPSLQIGYLDLQDHITFAPIASRNLMSITKGSPIFWSWKNPNLQSTSRNYLSMGLQIPESLTDVRTRKL